MENNTYANKLDALKDLLKESDNTLFAQLLERHETVIKEYELLRSFEGLKRVGDNLLIEEGEKRTVKEQKAYEAILGEMKRIYWHSDELRQRLRSEHGNLHAVFDSFDEYPTCCD